jgi:hypothetical protein
MAAGKLLLEKARRYCRAASTSLASSSIARKWGTPWCVHRERIVSIASCRRDICAILSGNTVSNRTLSLWICPGFDLNSIDEPRRAFTLGLHKARELGLRHAHRFASVLRDPVAQIRSG